MWKKMLLSVRTVVAWIFLAFFCVCEKKCERHHYITFVIDNTTLHPQGPSSHRWRLAIDPIMRTINRDAANMHYSAINSSLFGRSSWSSYDYYSPGFELRDIHSLGIVGTPLQHDGCVNVLKWKRDGTRIITGSDDRLGKTAPNPHFIALFNIFMCCVQKWAVKVWDSSRSLDSFPVVAQIRKRVSIVNPLIRNHDIAVVQKLLMGATSLTWKCTKL
jgi:hypothetical protein